MKKNPAGLYAISFCLVFLFTLTTFIFTPVQASAVTSTLTIEKIVNIDPGQPGNPKYPPADDPNLSYQFSVTLFNTQGNSSPIDPDEILRLEDLSVNITILPNTPNASLSFSLKAGEKMIINIAASSCNYNVKETGATLPGGNPAPYDSNSGSDDMTVEVDGNYHSTYPLASGSIEDSAPIVKFTHYIYGLVGVDIYHYEYRADGKYDPAKALLVETIFAPRYKKFTANPRTDIKDYECTDPTPKTGPVSEGESFFFTYRKSSEDIRGVIQWDDNSDSAKQRPGSVDVELLQDGTVVETKTVLVSSGNSQNFLFESMALNHTYVVRQAPDPAASGYDKAVYGKTDGVYTIMNRFTGSSSIIPSSSSWIPPISSNPSSDNPSSDTSSNVYPATGNGPYHDNGVGYTWALMNLVLCLLSLGVSLMLLLAFMNMKNTSRRFGQSHSGKIWWEFWLLSALTGVFAFLAFLFTGNLSGVMVLVDSWTLLIMTITGAQIVFFIVGWRQKKANDHIEENTQE